MTNIDVGVQEDSLAFLDTIVKYAPSLLAENSDKILPIFISMLSKLQSAPKTLNIHMSQKLTSINWTIKVLVRLSKLLEAVVANSQRERKDTMYVLHYFYMVYYNICFAWFIEALTTYTMQKKPAGFRYLLIIVTPRSAR